MASLRKARWLIAAITLVTASSWVVASNHCAFAAMKAAAKAEHLCCHKESPASPKPSTQCCEAFNVPIPDHVDAPVAQPHELKPAWAECLENIVLPPAPGVVALDDRGPPSVAEPLQVLLDRCAPAHAPPLFVA